MHQDDVISDIFPLTNADWDNEMSFGMRFASQFEIILVIDLYTML